MKHERIDIWQNGEYCYAEAYGFQPNLRTYLHEDGIKRPCVLVIPGGGYRFVSPAEGEIVAKWFYDKGYQTFVGTYTVNTLGHEPLKLQPLNDISRMVRVIRVRAEELCVDPDRIVLCGFSAGAHLCGSLCVHWQDIEDEQYDISNKPNGAILSYPVITSGEYAHRDSFIALLGADATQEELEYMSLEKQVTEKTPPIFLWQTATDEMVPVENSYLMAAALKRAGVTLAHHVFPKGKHGLSLANEDWAAHRYGEPYTREQMACTERAVQAGMTNADPFQMRIMDFMLHPDKPAPWPQAQDVAMPDVTIWPELAETWISTILGKQD